MPLSVAANHQTGPDRRGLFAAFGAYLMWGFLPLYLILVQAVPSAEFVAWRIIFTVPICLLIIMVRKQMPEIRAAMANRRVLLTLFCTAILIAINWFVYVWAIQNGHVYAASLGYYINPLLNVVLGTFFLGETLSRRQWFAVALAASGIALLLGGALTTLWISLTLASSFATYGLLRKTVAVGSLPGLTIESVLLLPLAFGIAWVFASGASGSAITVSPELTTAIFLGGVLTAVPLLLFAIAARMMDYSTLGFIQFLAPTIVFILGLTVFGEELQMLQLACFVMIWSAAAIFVWDLVQRSRRPA
ncbi:EamA family transporter RarD [Altererythrobacter aquiaggeris]|uniref:EamA family transporter RarD n=1 Tax=Aestuarierythrobacter aquiaggeris TaxID=1898396 RepID=UPI003AFB270F